jgi:hypothetical protein
MMIIMMIIMEAEGQFGRHVYKEGRYYNVT